MIFQTEHSTVYNIYDLTYDVLYNVIDERGKFDQDSTTTLVGWM